MKVYIVTEGEYSDSNIKAVFSTKKKANEYMSEYKKGYRGGKMEVSCWEVDSLSGHVRRPYWKVWIDIESGSIHPVGGTQESEMIVPSSRGRIEFLESIINAYSYESQEHAVKLAVEARQQYLHEGRTP